MDALTNGGTNLFQMVNYFLSFLLIIDLDEDSPAK